MRVLKESKNIIANIYDKDENIIETRHFSSRKQLDDYVNTLNNLVDMTMDKELYKNIKGNIDNIGLQDVWKIIIDTNITEERKKKPFIKRDAGNVEQNIATFNSMMATGASQGLAEDVHSPITHETLYNNISSQLAKDKKLEEKTNTNKSFNEMVDKLCQDKEFVNAFKQYMKEDAITKEGNNDNKEIKGVKRKMVKENLRNVSDVEEKSREVVSPAFASAVREIKTNDKLRDRASKLLKTPKEGKEDLPTKLTLEESLFTMENPAEVVKIKGENIRVYYVLTTDGGSSEYSTDKNYLINKAKKIDPSLKPEVEVSYHTDDEYEDFINGFQIWPNDLRPDEFKNITESLVNEDREPNIIRFIKGEFTKDELEQLRKDIVLNSIYTNDYENRFNISPEFVQDFFDGYSDWLDEAEVPEEKEDNIDNLESWYYTVDYSDYIDDPSKLEADYSIELNEDLDDDIKEITKESEEGSIEVDDEDNKYEVIRNLKRKGYHIETSYNDLSHKYHIEYWK